MVFSVDWNSETRFQARKLIGQQRKYCSVEFRKTSGISGGFLVYSSVLLSCSHFSLKYSRGCLLWVDTLRPRQNGRHFADDTFKYIFLNENVIISAKIWLEIVPKGPINNIQALVQIMACRRQGDKPLSEPMMARFPTHICVTRPHWVNFWFVFYLSYYRVVWSITIPVVWTTHKNLWRWSGSVWYISIKNVSVIIHPCPVVVLLELGNGWAIISHSFM